MEPFEQYHHYSQNLLLAQHEISEIIKHPLTRGEIREDFIIQYLNKSIQNCSAHLKRGFISLGGEGQSRQADILIVKQFAEIVDLGNRGNVIVNPEDCLMMIEVKSTLTGTYLNNLNETAHRIKAANPGTICGMFAYKSELGKRAIMKRCGHDYDSATATYFDSKEKPLPITYPFIDFIVLLDKSNADESEEELEMQGQNQLFLIKENEIEGRYFRGTYDPVIRNLVGLVKSLLMR